MVGSMGSRRWVFVSNEQSIKEGRVSLLAVFETAALVAGAIVLALSVPWGLRILAYAALLSLPGLIAHEDADVDAGPGWVMAVVWTVAVVGALIGLGKLFVVATQHIRGAPFAGGLAVVALVVLVLPVTATFALRAVGVVMALFRRPVEAIRYAPRTWFTRQFCVDFHAAPEVLPGLRLDLDFKGDRASYLADNTIPRHGRAAIRGIDGFLRLIVWAFRAVLGVTRAAFKATALLLLPLVWLAATAGITAKDAARTIAETYRAHWTNASYFVSLLSLALFGAKLGLYTNLNGLLDWWESIPALRVFDLHAAPREIPLWQVISALNAILMLVLVGQLDRVFSGIMDQADPIELHHTRARWILMGLRVRTLLTLYVLACVVALCIPLLNDLPPFRLRIWPP